MNLIETRVISAGKRLETFLKSPLFRYSLFFTAGFSLLANGFAYFNLYPQHDSVNHMFEFAGTWEISLGRFLMPLFGRMQGQITVPWLVGVMSIVFITGMVYMVCGLMDLTRPVWIAAVAGVLSANLSLAELSSVYTWTLAVYMLAAMLSCAGVYMLMKGKTLLRYPAAVLLIVGSISLYQAEVVFGIVLVAVLAVKDLVSEGNWAKVVLKYIKVALIFLCAALAYSLFYKLVLKLTGVQPANGYNSLSNLKNITVPELVKAAKRMYKFLRNFFFGSKCFVGVGLTRSCNTLLAVAAGLLLVFHFVRTPKNWVSHLLTVVILALIPGLVCTMDIMMRNWKLNFYLMYSLYLCYVLVLWLLVWLGRRYLSGMPGTGTLLIGLCFLLITAQNIIYSNQIYSNQKIMYDRSLSVTTRILDRMESDPDYIVGQTEVILVGNLRDNEGLKKTLVIDETLPETVQKNQGLRELLAQTGFNGGKLLSITYNQVFDSFAYFLGSEINYITEADIVSGYEAMEEVQNMPAYPYDGCCRMIEGRMVVKLS